MKQPVYASTVNRTVERINAENLDWLPHPANAALYLRADPDGIWMCQEFDDSRIVRIADSWMAARRVSLDKPEAPEAVAVLHDVPQESNADVMARAVAFVRDRRLTAEYVAAKDGYTGPAIEPINAGLIESTADQWADHCSNYRAYGSEAISKLGHPVLVEKTSLSREVIGEVHYLPNNEKHYFVTACEQERAIAAEQARADAARKLARADAARKLAGGI